jgi:hypothetical protein
LGTIKAGAFGTARRWRALILPGAIAVVWSGCVIDASNRCGPNEMVSGEIEVCVCVPNAVYTAKGCVPCGTNEVPGATACECATGFARDTAGVCQPVPAGLGTACSASMPCTDATYNHCATSANGDGYCTTSGCASNTDCSGGYACNTGATPAYCQRPPVGAGMSCTSNADCAGTEATYCDTFVQHACLVQGCTVTPNNCFSGTECCDLTSVGIPMPICIPQGACTT